MSIRPIPQATTETAPFWEAARGAQLQLPRCDDCQQFHYPPLERCPKCFSVRIQWTPLSGKCRLRAWTTIHMASIPGVDPPFTICEVEIAEQPDVVLVAHLAGIGPEQLTADREMQVGFVVSPNGTAYPQIEPV